MNLSPAMLNTEVGYPPFCLVVVTFPGESFLVILSKAVTHSYGKNINKVIVSEGEGADVTVIIQTGVFFIFKPCLEGIWKFHHKGQKFHNCRKEQP